MTVSALRLQIVIACIACGEQDTKKMNSYTAKLTCWNSEK